MICFSAILIALKFFGITGLYCYSIIAAIAANIQVLKMTNYTFWNEPMALGTVVFSTMFAVDNILNELFGQQAAKKCVWITFLGYLFFSMIMITTIFHPSPTDVSDGIDMSESLHNIFAPSFSLFLASVIAYLISNFTDIIIFSKLQKIFNYKLLVLRSCISISIASFIDNIVFSLIAWKLLSTTYVSWHCLWWTYIFGTYILRIGIAIMCVPVVKLAKYIVIKKNV